MTQRQGQAEPPILRPRSRVPRTVFSTAAAAVAVPVSARMRAPVAAAVARIAGSSTEVRIVCAKASAVNQRCGSGTGLRA